jgi:hypothetical protein
MSWRKFLTLVGGLSGESAFYHTLKNKPVVLETTDDIVADMRRMLSSKK